MVNYSNGIIYKLCCKDTSISDVYIGSTTNFSRRKQQHKQSCCNVNSEKYNRNVYKFIREHGNFDNWDMIMIYEGAFESKRQLETKEREYIELYKSTLNKLIPTRSKSEYKKVYTEQNKEKIQTKDKEYRLKNKEKISEKAKIYNEKNKEKIAKKSKEYYEKNREKSKEYFKEYYEKNKERKKEWYEQNNEKIKEKVICEICGCSVRKSHIRRHQRSKKCQECIN